MPSKNRPPSPSTGPTELPDAFQRHIEAALEKFHHADWLGEQSPLSAPYFLGARPGASGATAMPSALQRGQTLQRVLRQANDWLAAQDAEQQASSQLIQLTYFQATPLTVDEVASRLSLARATYYRRRDQALRRLSLAFTRQINPALRLDRPRQPDRLIGRDDVRAAGLKALQQGRTIGLSGPAGIGKTVLGATLIEQLGARRVFWFTFIPGLNDQPGSVLFALGYFLWQHSAPNLWGQLIADQGRLNLTVLLELLRVDLNSLQEAAPVLCFDEVDLLRPAEVEAHAHITALLGSLRGACACLFIGQRPVIEVDEHFVLDGLDEAASQEVLAAAGIDLAFDDRRRLLAQTGGNPRLLDLFISLQRSGESITEVLNRLQTSPSIEFLLNRIRQHLDPAEQALLDQLAVFRRPAPADDWPAALSTRLVDRHLVVRDGPGGLALLPALRSVLYEKLRPEIRQQSHLRAAQIRASRAEYTAAAYHYLRADQPRPAIWVWHAHRTEEINQGQGLAALALFEQIDDRMLAGSDRDTLALIRAELNKLAGRDPRDDLAQTTWQSPVLKAQAQRLEGDMAELRGQIDAAIAAYQAGLATVENLLAEKSLFDKNLGWTYLSQGGASLDLAWEKACLARFEAERLQGDIQARRGNLAEAEQHYTQALALAVDFHHSDGRAKTHNHLATLMAKQGRLGEAREHRQQAIALFQQMGNQVHLAGARLNMAFDHNLVGQQQAILPPANESLAPIFEQAVQAASEALKLFEQLGLKSGQVIAAQNLAEAHLYLNNLDRAEHYAQRVVEAQVSRVLPDGLRTLGEIRLRQRNYIDSEEYLQRALQAAQAADDMYLEAYGHRALMGLHLALGRSEQAQASFEQALGLFEKLDLPQEIERTRRAWQMNHA